MTAPDALRPPRQRWGLILLALVAFLVLPVLPTALRSFLPIAETTILLVAALAICSVVGWWRGGSPVLAAIWVVVAVWMLTTGVQPTGSFSSGNYDALVRGWTFLLMAAFGVTSLVTPNHPFFVRALSAVGLALTGAFILTLAAPNGLDTVRRTMVAESGRRTEHTIALFQQLTTTTAWKSAAARDPELDAMATQNEAELRKLPDTAGNMLPALLALESLAGLALGWALFHRLSPVAIGPAMRRLRDFRFNDQLIWGLAVGATLYFLPMFKEGRGVGLNLLVLFGMLYLLRGTGVLAWAARGRGVAIGLILLTAIAPVIAAALAFGIGVGDTWMDWRKRLSATR